MSRSAPEPEGEFILPPEVEPGTLATQIAARENNYLTELPGISIRHR